MRHHTPTFTIERLMTALLTLSVVFFTGLGFGLYIGEERAAVKLQPCPKLSAAEQRKLRWPGIRDGEKLMAYFKREGVVK